MNREQDLASACKAMDDEELKRVFYEAAELYEYHGGHWAARIVRAEVEARKERRDG